MKRGIEERASVMSYGAMTRKFDPLTAEARWKTRRFGMNDFDAITKKDQGTTISPEGQALAVIGAVVRIEQCVGEFQTTSDHRELGYALRAAQKLHDLVGQNPINDDPFIDPRFPGGKYPGYGR